MKLYFKYLYAFILSMSALMANAQQITEQEAKQIASSFLATSSARRRIPSANELKLAYISESQGKKHYYVFNNGINNSGFVIVGGDKVANSILGYSENGTFDYANMPDNVKWWLSQYDIQIATAIEQQSTHSAEYACLLLRKE